MVLLGLIRSLFLFMSDFFLGVVLVLVVCPVCGCGMIRAEFDMWLWCCQVCGFRRYD